VAADRLDYVVKKRRTGQSSRLRSSRFDSKAAGSTDTGGNAYMLLRARQKYIASCVDAAIAPLRRYLNVGQARLVRSIVEASIQADPVSRRLLANALRLHLRSYHRALRARGRKAKLKEINNEKSLPFPLGAVLHDLAADADAPPKVEDEHQ
jgi:hypothetical protein